MTYIVITESGSEYHVTPDLKVWTCKKSTTSGLRTESGMYEEWSGAHIGQRMRFIGQGLVFGTRLITTSPVMSVDKAGSCDV